MRKKIRLPSIKRLPPHRRRKVRLSPFPPLAKTTPASLRLLFSENTVVFSEIGDERREKSSRRDVGAKSACLRFRLWRKLRLLPCAFSFPKIQLYFRKLVTRDEKKAPAAFAAGAFLKILLFLRFSAFSVYRAQKPSEAGFVRKRRKNGAVGTLPDRVE